MEKKKDLFAPTLSAVTGIPEVKHGFAFQGDAEPSFFKDFKWSSEYDEIYTYSDWKSTGEETRARLVHYFMSEEYVTLEFDNGHAITVLPCQIQFINDDIDDMQIKVRDLKDVVADYAHSIPDMFRYLHEHHVALGFHPAIPPQTLKFLHDISLLVLRPMAAVSPNVNMQEVIKEILWHMNNHVDEYLEELNNVQIKPGSVQTVGVNAESKD